MLLLIAVSIVSACGAQSGNLPGAGGQTMSSKPDVQAEPTEPAEPTELAPTTQQDEEMTLDEMVASMLEDASLEAIDTEDGQHKYAEVCAPCHGQEATGIAGIDVNLRRSKFVGGATIEQTAVFLIRGLSINNPFNITEIRMPPRGGRKDMTSQDMLNIAAYLKSINTQELGEERVSAYFDWLMSGEADEMDSTPEIGHEGLSGAALDGQTTYLRFCAVCHGPNGEGVDSLGKGFRSSTFIPDLTDEELVEFLSVGRADDDPLNETGIEMLPFGGQPYLTEDELMNVVAYIRAVNTGEFVPPVPSDVETTQFSTGDILPNQEEAYALIESISPRCFACHLIGDRGNKNGPGPHLNGLKDRAGERIPGLSAEEYVRQSIMDPGAFLVDECPRGPCVDVMSKNYSDKLSEEDLNILIPFLLSLPAEK